jgi:signal transduction histidine kinase/CheY-like chemotaxis protein
MLDNALLFHSVVKYFETEQCAIAVSNGDFKLVWFNKPFKNLFRNKKLKGASLFKLFGMPDSLKINRTETHFLPLPSLNSNLKIIPINEKKNAPKRFIIKVEPFENKFASGFDDEILQHHLLFQKELQNTLSLLLKEKSLKVITEELIKRCISISKGNFGLVVFHNDLNKYSFQYFDPEKILSNTPDIEKEINANFSFLSKWFSINKRSLIALNISDNIGYNLARIFQSHALTLTPCFFDNQLLATIIVGKLNDGFSPLEITNIEQFAAILSFSISSINTRELNVALENRLLQVQKLETIGKLTSGMAHDFNNLLSSIFGSINLLKKGGPVREDYIRLLDNIENCSIRARDLTKGLLSFGKPNSKRKELVKPNDLLGEIAKVISQTFPKRINIECDIADSLYDILGNSTEIYQVVLNLCVNAKEAIESRGTISLSAHNITINEKNVMRFPLFKKDNYVHISVSDTGSGIKEENILRIFDPYFSTKVKDTGSGLGLYVTYGIIKAHQGYIEVTSKENEKTTFEVFLPSFEPNAIGKSIDENKIILLVDDEIMLRDLLADLLESNGFNVIKVSSGMEALTVLTEEMKVDLIIIDYNMPEMNGLQCIQRIRELNFKIPIILSTGSISVESKIDLPKFGINSLLCKPYEFDAMMSTIKKLI